MSFPIVALPILEDPYDRIWDMDYWTRVNVLEEQPFPFEGPVQPPSEKEKDSFWWLWVLIGGAVLLGTRKKNEHTRTA